MPPKKKKKNTVSKKFGANDIANVVEKMENSKLVEAAEFSNIQGEPRICERS